MKKEKKAFVLNCIIVQIRQRHLAKSGCHFDFTQGATFEQLSRKVKHFRAPFKKFWSNLWLRLTWEKTESPIPASKVKWSAPKIPSTFHNIVWESQAAIIMNCFVE